MRKLHIFHGKCFKEKPLFQESLNVIFCFPSHPQGEIDKSHSSLAAGEAEALEPCLGPLPPSQTPALGIGRQSTPAVGISDHQSYGETGK